jgi:hypothetical protein
VCLMLGGVTESMWGEALECHDRACKHALAGPDKYLAPDDAMFASHLAGSSDHRTGARHWPKEVADE